MNYPIVNNVKINMNETHRIVGREKYGENGVEVSYVRNRETDKLTILRPHATQARLIQLLTSIFLPQGYPHSVSEDYIVYQAWDTVQAFASSITGSLATQSVLKGVGVGNENATPLAATITWLLKDGTGMLGRIIFAWFRGSDLDCHSKHWRLIADVLNDAAICLELFAQFFEDNLFTVIICGAGVMKAIVGVAGGATRAALVQHQAQRNNLADVSAKDGSQETLVNLAALICSIILLPLVADNQTLMWTLYVVFTCLHLYANFMAVSSVVMPTLNQSRFYILAHYYLFSGGDLLSKKTVNQRELIFIPKPFPLKIRLGRSLQNLTTSYSGLTALLSLNSESKYLLNFNKSKGEIDIVLHEDCTSNDQYKAFFQAVVLCTSYDNVFKGVSGIAFKELENITAALEQRTDDISNVLKLSRQLTEDQFPIFMDRITEKQWDVDQCLLGADEWRVMWNAEGLDEKTSLNL